LLLRHRLLRTALCEERPSADATSEGEQTKMRRKGGPSRGRPALSPSRNRTGRLPASLRPMGHRLREHVDVDRDEQREELIAARKTTLKLTLVFSVPVSDATCPRIVG